MPRHASWVTEVGGVRIVGLDSTVPGEPGAEVDEERERWLRDVLAVEFDGVTILAMHHPPFATGVGWMDASGFVGLDRLEAVLVANPVDKVVCGHFHRPVEFDDRRDPGAGRAGDRAARRSRPRAG